MKDRIRQLIDFTQMSQQDFANAIGVSPASLSSIFTGRTNPTNNHVQAIHRAFPEVNINWLLFGEGDMLLSGADGATADAAPGGSTAALADGMATGIGADSAFSVEDDPRAGAYADASINSSPASRRDAYGSKVAGFQFSDAANKYDKRERKIKEIRVFFDDGTYESFVPSLSK